MLFNLSDNNSIANQFIAELRDVNVQKDRMRFRRNVERLGQIFAYEISKTLNYKKQECETPLGVAHMQVPQERIVVASILRAGLPLHHGILSYFDEADNAFISAYRMHHKDGTFEINLEYVTCPDLNDATLIICDPMLATGSSFDAAYKVLLEHGKPRAVHFVSIIASTNGLNYVNRKYSAINFWLGDIDEELTAKSYIVPGLGDAGDLLYGAKLQD